jgi:hypothetical protein
VLELFQNLNEENPHRGTSLVFTKSGDIMRKKQHELFQFFFKLLLDHG